MLDIKTLPDDVQVRLESLRARSLEDLTEEEHDFLMARRAYLRPDEVEHFDLEARAVETAERKAKQDADEAPTAPVAAAKTTGKGSKTAPVAAAK